LARRGILRRSVAVAEFNFLTLRFPAVFLRCWIVSSLSAFLLLIAALC